MGDLALRWDNATGDADLAIEDDDLASEEGLRTAVYISLFTDRRAEDDDPLPAEDGDRRGWWADELSEVEGDRIGSRLWLLARSKLTPDLVPRAEELAREALAWLLEDRVAEEVRVSAEVADRRLLLTVTIFRPAERDPVTYQFDHVWAGEAAA